MEHETKNTDALTNKSEHVELERYEVISDDLIRVAEQTNPMQRLVAMRGFVAELRAEAAGGYIKNSDGDPYESDQFNLQLTEFVRQSDLPEDKREYKNPLVLIPKSEGMRRAFTALVSDEATAQPLLRALAEKPSPETQEAVEQHAERAAEQAREVGGQALKSADVTVEAQEAIDPIDQLPSSVKDEVLHYRRLSQNYREAVKAKDFALAGEDKKDLYTAGKRLSPQAKAFLGL